VDSDKGRRNHEGSSKILRVVASYIQTMEDFLVRETNNVNVCNTWRITFMKTCVACVIVT